MTKPDEQCKAAAEAIKRLDADVLALEEVESYEALMWFRDKYLTGLGYEHVVSIDSGDPRGIECSVLSRLPLSDPKVWPGLPLGGTHPDKFGNEPNREAGKPIEFHRSPLRVTVQVAEKPEPLTVTLFVVHYKSGRGGGYWREREAAKTAELVKEYTDAHAGAAVLVLGDFNSQVREQPLKTLIDSGLESAFKDRAGSDPLTTTHSSGRVIDHILLNPAAQARLVPQTRFVLGMPTRPAKADWRTTPPPAGYASDHFPVSIDLQVAEPEHR